RDVSRYPRARLLGDERYPDAPSERADRLERATRAGLPLGLDALLEIVEMDGERVRLDHRDDLRDVARAQCHLAVLLHELRDAEVRDDERARGSVSDHRVRRREHRIADRGALAADTHRDAVTLGPAREQLVHGERGTVTAGHPGDYERKREPVAEEG